MQDFFLGETVWILKDKHIKIPCDKCLGVPVIKQINNEYRCIRCKGSGEIGKQIKIVVKTFVVKAILRKNGVIEYFTDARRNNGQIFGKDIFKTEEDAINKVKET